MAWNLSQDQIAVYDQREKGVSKILRLNKMTQGTVNTENKSIHSLEWSPCGNFLLVASSDGYVNLVDFKAEKIIFSFKVTEEGKVWIVFDYLT